MTDLLRSTVVLQRRASPDERHREEEALEKAAFETIFPLRLAQLRARFRPQTARRAFHMCRFHPADLLFTEEHILPGRAREVHDNKRQQRG